MTRRRALAVGWLAALGLAPATARAQLRDDGVPRVSMRFDTLFRGLPRYALTATDRAATADQRYWRVIAAAPLYQRAALDARALAGGLVDAHLVAWGVIDLAGGVPDGRVAGDVAVAWARASRGPWGAWGGRRFLAWGPPGGLHVDGVGVEVTTPAGFNAEAMVGRPVTPVYDNLTGPRPGFEGVTVAYGARAGWALAGRFAAAAAYVERWADGVPGVRVASGDVAWTPAAWLDVRGSVAADAGGGEIIQASADAAWVLGGRGELALGYAHANPARLIPRWSILSVFATSQYDEASLAVLVRPARALSLRVEAAAQHYDAPGADDQTFGPRWGYRVDGVVRWSARDRRTQLVLHATRRDDGTSPLTVLRAAGAWTVGRDVALGLEAAAALENDDPDAPRSSLYARGSLEVPLGGGWRAGASVDGVRSPIAAAELRGMAHAVWVLDVRGRRP